MTGTILASIAAGSLIAVGAHAVLKQRSLSHGVLLVAAVLLAGIGILDQLSLQPALDVWRFREFSLFLESLLPGCFLLLSLVYGRSNSGPPWPWARIAVYSVISLLPVGIVAVSGANVYFSPDFPQEKILFLENEGYWFYVIVMAALVVSLVNMEATLVASQNLVRYRIKFEFFGLMSLLAVLIFYYSQALLYHTINMNLTLVRSTVVIIAALLIGYSRIFRGNGIRVSVSRHVLYRSVTLLVVGLYLITLAVMGEGMRYFGDGFGRNLMIILAFGGGIVLIAVLFSEKARRTAKVYIHKHFYANKHDYRAEWIRLTERLSKCSTLDGIGDAIISAYLNTFDCKGASLSLLDKTEKQYIPASVQSMPLAPSSVTLSDELKAYFLNRNRVLNPSDREHPLTLDEIEAFRKAGVFLVVPLIANGRVEGMVMLREQLVPRVLIYDDYDLMKVMARQAAQAIANVRLSEEVIEMRAMAAVARMSSFVIHDLKNLTTSLSLVVNNAEVHMSNPDFQKDAIRTIGNTLAKMRGLVQRLKAIPAKGRVEDAVEGAVEDIHAIAQETVEELKTTNGPNIECAGASVYARVDREQIKKVLVNLIRNGLEAGGGQARVRVETFADNGKACMRVADNGAGMSADFIKSRLFKPFSTTKETGLGIGLYQSRQIVTAHAGRIEVASEISKGTVFTVILPAAQQKTDSGGGQQQNEADRN